MVVRTCAQTDGRGHLPLREDLLAALELEDGEAVRELRLLRGRQPGEEVRRLRAHRLRAAPTHAPHTHPHTVRARGADHAALRRAHELVGVGHRRGGAVDHGTLVQVYRTRERFAVWL